MDQFTFSDCKIYWRIGSGGTRAKAKSVVIRELERISNLIYEAMNFSKTWSIREDRDILVKIYLSIGARGQWYDYDVDIVYARDTEGWYMNINLEDDEVGKVVSRKWNILRGVPTKEGGMIFAAE